MVAIEVKTLRGVLAAGYQPAALLQNCVLQRVDKSLNEQRSDFTAQFVKKDLFWLPKATQVILCMAKAYWWWTLEIKQIGNDKLEGIAWGNPVVTSGLPPSLQGWKNEQEPFYRAGYGQNQSF